METQKTHYHHTFSQSSIHVSERKEDNTNLSLSQGSKPTFRHIERSIIPLKCSKGMQVFIENSNRFTQTPKSRSLDACNQAVATCKNTCSHYNSSHPTHTMLKKGYSNLVRDEKFWESFANYLESQGQTRDFVNLANGLKSGSISHQNLSWLSALHMGHYSSCETTCSMCYDKTLLEFYQLYYLLFRSCALSVLRGPSHFRNVVTGTAEKSKYNPCVLKINFPVPSTSFLKRMKTGYPKTVNPGLVEAILDIFEDKAHQGKQFVLSFNGMKVSRGGKDVTDNDVDLWGMDGPPTVNEAIKKLEQNLEYLRKISKPIDSSSIHFHSIRLQNVHSRLTKKLAAMRKRLTGKYLLERKLESI